ncbi:MAG: DNA polymerase III subunit gamma and tau [Propionibacteriaceae bacterium]|nr:DNA polymerase III subunit gamma and tau [Propionibacteriaceae bacterium]
MTGSLVPDNPVVNIPAAEPPLALYRRYRPDRFADVIGQEHVTEPLRRALTNNRVNHAYLFSGPRGCGKTSSARILARALNCRLGPTPDPCGECDSCRDLATGGNGSIDVIEIDAASHGGVDDARDLRERAFFAPVQSRYKVYIVDEAHMVTTQGFNALLKLVEEPPPPVKFIFATTEPDKVIGTIRSRTHHYPFRLVPPRLLGDYLNRICQREQVVVEPGVIPLVVRAGAGSVRDALSVLDQLLGAAGVDGVGYAQASALLGYTPDSLLDEFVDALAAGDAHGVFATVDKVVEAGQEPRRFAEDLLSRLRDLIIVGTVPDAFASGLIDVSQDQADRYLTQSKGLGPGELTRAAEVLAAGLTAMRGTTAPRLQLELMCARLLLPGADVSGRGVHARLDRLERRLDMPATGGGATPAAAWGGGSTRTQAPAGGPGGGATAGEGPNQPPPDWATPTDGPTPERPWPAGGDNRADGSTAGRPWRSQTGDRSTADPRPAGPPEGSADDQSGSLAPRLMGQPSLGDGPATTGPRGVPDGRAPADQGLLPDHAGPGPASGSARAAADPGLGRAPAPDPGTGFAGILGQNSTGAPSGVPGPSSGNAPSGDLGSGSGDAPAAGPGPVPSGAPAASERPPASPDQTGGRPDRPAGPPGQPGAMDVAEIRRHWPTILDLVKQRRKFTWFGLQQAQVTELIMGKVLWLTFANPGARINFVGRGEDDLRQVIIDSLGVELAVRSRLETDPPPRAEGVLTVLPGEAPETPRSGGTRDDRPPLTAVGPSPEPMTPEPMTGQIVAPSTDQTRAPATVATAGGGPAEAFARPVDQPAERTGGRPNERASERTNERPPERPSRPSLAPVADPSPTDPPIPTDPPPAVTDPGPTGPAASEPDRLAAGGMIDPRPPAGADSSPASPPSADPTRQSRLGPTPASPPTGPPDDRPDPESADEDEVSPDDAIVPLDHVGQEAEELLVTYLDAELVKSEDNPPT